ncbi:hypothetical protein ACSBR2_016952 [Camellia fascicularis]
MSSSLGGLLNFFWIFTKFCAELLFPNSPEFLLPHHTLQQPNSGIRALKVLQNKTSKFVKYDFA